MSIYTTTTSCLYEEVTLELTSDNKEKIVMAPPPEFKGPEGYWTPENLFSASISSCYLLTFKALARLKKMEWIDLTVTADASLEKTEKGLKFTRVEIKPVLTICCTMNVDPYLELLMKAKDSCLVTASMNCEFIVIPKVKVKAKK